MERKSGFTVTSLGGAGEIGKNCAVIEVDGDLFVIDCGISFPSATIFGVDIIIPDFTYIYRNQKRLKGLFLTHGHEDHIGAVPYLIEGLDNVLQVYGTKLTLGLLRNKLVEREQLGLVELHEIVPREEVKVNGTTITGYSITHSIPDAVSIALRTPYGIVLHSGDYKLDPSPVDGRLTDVEGLSKLGKEGVVLLMCDITNVERPGRTMSESAVGPALEKMISQAPGRVFTTTFASNIHRIQQVINASSKLGRKVAVVGRSMIRNIAMAEEIGYLSVPSGVLIDIFDVGRYPAEQVSVIVTGSQGEPMAALTQISQDRHARISIEKGDTVIFSASPIPGNETAIFSVIDDLFKLGAEVVYGQQYGVHASGHGSQEDIAEYVGMLSPDFIMPHHGQYRHLRRFISLAADLGYPREKVILAEIGEQWHFDESGFEMVGKTRAGVVYISGAQLAEVGRRTIIEREELARDGTLYIGFSLSMDGRHRMSEVVVEHKGFFPKHKDPELYEQIKEAVIQGIAKNRLRSSEYRLQLQNNVGQLVATIIESTTGLKPNVQVLANYIDRDEPIIEPSDSP